MKKHFIFFCCLGILSSCKDEPIPAYLHVPSISVAPRSFEGSSSSNISDVWVYQDLNLQGAYELPVEFPILAEGKTRLIVYGGIKLNGISTTRAIYPFYDPDTVDVTFNPPAADTIFPVVRYSSNSFFDFIEGFENANNFDNMERITGSDVFEGGFSGKLIADDVEVIAASNSSYQIPFGSSSVFLEMDYKNTHIFEVGLIAIAGSDSVRIYKLTVPPRDAWNKLYINFTPEVNALQAESYRIYYRMVPTTDAANIHLFFDNVKLIHAKI